MSGGNKNKVQRHKNKVAFKIQFNPLALQIHKKVSLKGLCKRCADQISWKMQYNKYKKMSEPSKCNICLQKNVTRSYMNACDPCSQALKMCPKCLDPQSEEQIEVRLNQSQQKKQDEENERKMNEFLKTLKERSRRTVKRLYQKGKIQWNPELNNFVDQQESPLTLQFRQGYGDKNTQNGEEEDQIDEFGSEDDEQESQTEQKQQAYSNKKQKDNTNNKQQNNDKQGGQDSQDEDNQNEEIDEEQIDEAKEDEENKSAKQGNPKQQEQNEEDWSDCQQQGQQQAN